MDPVQLNRRGALLPRHAADAASVASHIRKTDAREAGMQGREWESKQCMAQGFKAEASSVKHSQYAAAVQ